MRSPRTEPTFARLLRRLDVRLVLILASVALIGLLVSGLALSQILPQYFDDQAKLRLQNAGAGTALLIRLRAETLLEHDPGQLSSTEVRQGRVLQQAAQDAATAFSLGSVIVINSADGSRAATGTVSDAASLAKQGLRPDNEVPAYPIDLAITLPQPAPPLTKANSDSLPLRVIVASPYTSRAQTLDQVRGTLIAVGILALVTSAFVGLLAARRLTDPIGRLQRVAGRLAHGQLDERVAPSGVVEIDELGRQFNIMADRLSESLRLLEADRDRLREFVADVSHELRTPIAALRTFTELQRDGDIDAATRREFLDRSREQLSRLEWLSSNLLDLSRIEAGIFPLDMRVGDLRDPIRSVVEAHAEMAEEHGVALSSVVPRHSVMLRFDQERIVQLASNLIGNALKFTPHGGEVAVRLLDDAEEIVLEVRDTGPGIPEPELPRIFERFYRGTNVGEARASGSGLGLSIVRSIVELHGGSIEVASVLGQGATFRVRVPRPPATEPEADPGTPALLPVAPPRKRGIARRLRPRAASRQGQ